MWYVGMICLQFAMIHFIICCRIQAEEDCVLLTEALINPKGNRMYVGIT